MKNGADTCGAIGPRVIDDKRLEVIHGTTRFRDRHRPARVKNTGEERQHATDDPRALLSGDIPFTVKEQEQ